MSDEAILPCLGTHKFKLDDLTVPGKDLLVCQACGYFTAFDLAHKEWMQDSHGGTVADKAGQIVRKQAWEESQTGGQRR